MRNTMLLFCISAAVFLTGSFPAADRPMRAPAATPTPQPEIVLAYYTGSPESFAALQEHAARINVLSSDVFAVEPDGGISGKDVRDAAGFAAAQGIQTYACVSNYNAHPAVDDFDPRLAQAAVVTHRQETLAALMELARDAQYAGINLDFENLAFSDDIRRDRRDFTAFVTELAQRLHAAGKRLIVSVPAKTEDSPEDEWSYPFDMAALGREADYLQLMTYDQHGPWSDAGPVAGADWVEACLRYAVSRVAARKLLIGLPAYGYDWNLDSGGAEYFGWKALNARLDLPGARVDRDEESGSPYVKYISAGQRHVAWYEDAQSLRLKTGMARNYALGGVSIWALGTEDAAFWRAVAGVP